MTVVYTFVDSIRTEHPIKQICKVLRINRSCFYEWSNKTTYQIKAEDKIMEQTIIKIFKVHKQRYGSRRIVAELGNQDVRVSPYKVRKCLDNNGLKAKQPRSFVPKTTNSRHPYAISPNHLKGMDFPGAINKVWVGDITYIPLVEGKFCYLSAWMDLCSRKIVGWALRDHMRESLVTVSLTKALKTRAVKPGLLTHTDRGGQYAGKVFRQLLQDKQLVQSMSDADNPYDNAHMESFFSRFKAELLEGGAFQNIEDAQTEIFEYIEMYYNPSRLHSSLDYMSPDNFEKALSLNKDKTNER